MMVTGWSAMKWCRAPNGLLPVKAKRRANGTAPAASSAPAGFTRDMRSSPAASRLRTSSRRTKSTSGKQQGWLPVGDSPEDRWHREAFERHLQEHGTARDGTYGLLGPKIQSNPDRRPSHVLIPHGEEFLEDAPRDFDHLRDYLRTRDTEGIVWHHPDGRMVKIKAKDFGLK